MEREELDGVSFVESLDEYNKRNPDDKCFSKLRKSILFVPDTIIDKEILADRGFEYGKEDEFEPTL